MLEDQLFGLVKLNFRNMATPIRIDLEQPGYLGLNEELRCTGFRVFISLAGDIQAIELYYSKCVLGLDGTLQEVSSYTSRYTDDNKRVLLDGEGNPVTHPEVVPVFDVDGITPLYEVDGITPLTETIQVPTMIGVITFWKMSLGDAYIIPDLQITLDSIASTYRN